MKIEVVGIDDIKAYAYNAKEHPREQIEQIKKSILDFQNNDPIAVDENGIIIEGHGRYIALKELGFDEVEIIRLTHLTEEQKKAYRLVHNKLTMNSDFDFELLEKEIAELSDIGMDMSAFGFIEDFEEEVEELEKENPEIEFTKCVEENHNYIVLFFDNNIDWLQAQSIFELKTVKEYSTRKDGVIKKETRGIGRVINGAEALSKMTEGLYGENQHKLSEPQTPESENA